jgi:glycosyltransferase involved in cell wall biosynthesis
VRHGNYYGAVGAEFRALRQALRESRPAVILCHFGHMALRVLPIARQLNIPVVAHFHGFDLSAALRNRWYRWSLTRHAKHFTANVVVAEYQCRELLNRGVQKERIHLIPCGAPVDEIRLADNVATQPCRFLAIGRLIEKKAPLATLRAFAECCKAVPDVTLTIIGDGPLRPAIESLCQELGIDSQVKLLGRQPSDVVTRELQRSSVFVQHSVRSAIGDMEGWPVSVAEAMATGLPVAGTRHAGITAQVIDGETGFLVDEQDWRAMGRQMALLASNPELRIQMGRRSAEVARERFDQREMTNKLEEVLISAAEIDDGPITRSDAGAATGLLHPV